MKKVLLLIVLISTILSCRSVDKYVERGDYDAAIDYAVDKLSKRKELKTRDVKAMEYAFNSIKKKEEQDIFRKYSSSNSEWGSIYGDIQNIDRLQKRVNPYLPIISKDGYRAKFSFINVGKLQEKALYEANQRDLKEISQIHPASDADGLLRIYDLYERIELRQRFILNNPKIIGLEGYIPEFKMAEVAKRKSDAKSAAVESLYVEGISMMNRAKATRDKKDARTAHKIFIEIMRLTANYKDVASLHREAKDLGTVHVLVSLENNSPSLLPRQLADYIIDTNFSDLNDKWTTFYTRESERNNYDVKAVVDILDMDVSPEREQVRSEILTKEIIDGWVYQFDGNGNVMKDTLGNDIKLDRYVEVNGEFITIARSKYAIITGAVKYKDMKSGAYTKGRPIDVEYVFEDEAYDFRGDDRVLTSRMKQDLRKAPRPFPTHLEVAMLAGEILRKELRTELARMIFINEWYA